MKQSLLIFICLSLFISCNQSPETNEPDMKDYFKKMTYSATPLPTYADSKQLLPSPILDDNPGWIDMYWTCWEIAFRGLKQPPEGSPLVSNWLDEAFSENIFQWDTIFMMLFARYGHDAFPAIQSLDNFYALQDESGYIGREYREKDGKLIHFDHGGGLFADTGYKNTINPPLFSWAEVESFRITGDKSRFKKVLPVLESYAEYLNRDGDPDALDWQNQGRISKTAEHKLYWNTPLGSGMDNTPRPAKKGAGWVEMSAQMVINYNNLAVIAAELDMKEKAAKFEEAARSISNRINQWCWNEEDGFYYDVLADGTQFPKMTIGGYWPMLAGVASRTQADQLVKHLKDEDKFWRPFLFPTLSADEEEYEDYGGYWLGGVWAPTNVVVIKGLERYGYEEFAAETTEKYLEAMYIVYKDSGTVYENYAPEHMAPGDPSKPDFVGWTGCGPIQLLFENVMGLRPDGVNNALTWKLRRADRHGVVNLKLASNTVSLICSAQGNDEKRTLNVSCKKAFRLNVQTREGS
ncbi:MAG: trehalase family glycosidase, partial [Calditrichota bacterium]